MYWNAVSGAVGTVTSVLNSNIRCIEIPLFDEYKKTIDKLNSNIRCIEIQFDLAERPTCCQLNSNIRCIEI